MNENVKFLMDKNDLKVDQKFILKNINDKVVFKDISPFWINVNGELCGKKDLFENYKSIAADVLGNIVLEKLTICKVDKRWGELEPTPIMKALGVEYNKKFKLIYADDLAEASSDEYEFTIDGKLMNATSYMGVVDTYTLQRIIDNKIVVKR